MEALQDDGEQDPEAGDPGEEEEPHELAELVDDEFREPEIPDHVNRPRLNAEGDEENPRVGVNNGYIIYYIKAKKFKAVCTLKTHKGDIQCAITRSARLSAHNKAQGSPLGLLMAWHIKKTHETMKSRHKHVHEYNITLKERQDARAIMKRERKFDILFQYEREGKPVPEGEEEEPEDEP